MGDPHKVQHAGAGTSLHETAGQVKTGADAGELEFVRITHRHRFLLLSHNVI